MAGGYVPSAAQKAADAAQMEQLRAILISSLDSVVKDNLPGATKMGRYWQADSIDGGNGTAFVVFADGGWSDFRNGAKHGDLLQLIAHHRFGGNVGEAIRWGKSHYGIDSMDPGRVKQVLAQAAADKAERSAKDEAEAKLFKKRAGHLWSGGVPIEGTPAEAYLIGRGIDLRPFGKGWPTNAKAEPVGVWRFQGACPWWARCLWRILNGGAAAIHPAWWRGPQTCTSWVHWPRAA